MTLPEVIKRRRLAKNLTQEGLAAAAHLGLRTVQRVEHGSHFPTVATLEKLAGPLGTNAAQLIREASLDEPKAAVG